MAFEKPRIEHHSETYWTGTGWKGQVIETNFNTGVCKILWTTPNEYEKDDEEMAHMVCKKWGSDEHGFDVEQSTDTD